MLDIISMFNLGCFYLTLIRLTRYRLKCCSNFRPSVSSARTHRSRNGRVERQQQDRPLRLLPRLPFSNNYKKWFFSFLSFYSCLLDIAKDRNHNCSDETAFDFQSTQVFKRNRPKSGTSLTQNSFWSVATSSSITGIVDGF